MKIRRLILQDFRQFHGRQELLFGTTERTNVSIIYAANGAGKTTLLNAFTWALYKKLGDDVEQPDRLINNITWDACAPGSSASASVTVEFDHEDRMYTATRVFEARKAEDGSVLILKNGDVTLRYIEEDGQSGELKNPSNALDQILPERLHRFFFFNGERIEHLVKPSAYEEIQQAIKTLLGLEAVERGIRHTDDAIKRLRRELKQVASGETQEVVDELERLKTERSEHESAYARFRERLELLRTESETIQQRLRMMEDTRKLQERRDQLRDRVKDSRRTEGALGEQLRVALAERGFIAFTGDLVDQTLELIEANRVRGELPAPLKRQFVEDLLENGECICGTGLVKGDDLYRRVAEWTQKAGVADIETALIGVGAHAADFAAARASLTAQLSKSSATMANQIARRHQLEKDLEEVSDELKDLPLEEAQKLESRRLSVDQDVGTTQFEMQRERAEVDAKGNSIALKERELERLEQANVQAQVALRRVKVATEARDVLTAVYEMRTHDVRTHLDTLIRDEYIKISFKHYVPELNEGFELRLRDPHRDGELVPRSTGENQILSLAFVGALAETARRKIDSGPNSGNLGSLMGFEGGSYPIVMDAAFGNLDDNYRRSVAIALPDLTDQVIIFVSKSQGLGAVHEELHSKIADEYVIEYHTPKEDFESESISLNGKEYPYITRSTNGHEWASIERVSEQ